ncbi:GNAT family N-acetyltransferase [Mucilaginibacter glaciei]|uniref:GNAT family N-acetyltransferase n=1 Tax=Mucilaginibacter glaciei TaxID=2772109 RepID=A0A926NMU4_9SPHI|nr:GNAT family N-acetyltransferase [Mucilaginibacter glaciei]MBD1392103.1 GNAT family N-acetyltransferase [Mucilaginibacter glaciei]
MSVFMNDAAFQKKGFKISTDRSLLQSHVIYAYLVNDSYWAQGLPYDKFETSLANSICFGVYKNDEQAGFARVVTDKATFAYVCDVFVLPAHRGLGISKWLVQTILAHDELQELRRWSLATLDAHGLYSQFGFTEIKNPERWMQIYSPYLKD